LAKTFETKYDNDWHNKSVTTRINAGKYTFFIEIYYITTIRIFKTKNKTETVSKL